MKKILIILTTLISIGLNAQDKIGLNVKVGLAVVNPYKTGFFSTEKAVTNRSELGYLIGASYEMLIRGNLYFEPGLFYQKTSASAFLEKGYVIGITEKGYALHNEHITHNKLILPLILKSRFELRKYNMCFGLGFYTEGFLDSHIQAEFNNPSRKYHRKTEEFSVFEFGLKSQITIEIKDFTFGVMFNQGLYNTEYTYESLTTNLFLGLKF